MSPRGKEPPTSLWYWFAVTSVVFLVVLAISPAKDYWREYRGYQRSYRKLLMASASSRKELERAKSLPLQVHQLWIPKLDDTVDRCTTCHLGVENQAMKDAAEPYRLHPETPHTPGSFDRFGCVVCHRGQGRATSVAAAHGRVPDWDSPLLPLSYTEAGCGVCHKDQQVPEASLLSSGRELMGRVGCYGCHKLVGHESWKGTAPRLNGLGQKTNVAWLKAWLLHPRNLRPKTWMPDFHLSDPEGDSLIAFLWDLPPATREPAAAGLSAGGGPDQPAGDPDRGKTLFRESRCISCHTVDGKGDGSAPELGGVGSKVTRPWLLAFLRDPQAMQPETPMPRYHFSESDLVNISAYIMEELVDPAAPEPIAAPRYPRKMIDAGERLYKKYACGGCHAIEGRSFIRQTGPTLDGIGTTAVSLLDFGSRTDLPRRLPDWLAAKLLDPRSFRAGLKMPDFGFTDEQVQALVTALLACSDQVIPESYRVIRPPTHYVPPGRFGELVSRYRCMSCHLINGAGGDIATAPLGSEGSKVREDWLEHYLLLPTTIRPLLSDRMIPLQMPEEQAAFLANFMTEVYVDNRIPREIQPQGASDSDVERGGHLFHERYGCQACHILGGKGGYYGPPLDGAAQKLRSGWVYWWLLGPQKWRADVRCPNYGLDESDARQLAAYLLVSTGSASGTGGENGGGSR